MFNHIGLSIADLGICLKKTIFTVKSFSFIEHNYILYTRIDKFNIRAAVFKYVTLSNFSLLTHSI